MFLFIFLTISLLVFYGVLIAYYRNAWKSIPLFSPGTDTGGSAPAGGSGAGTGGSATPVGSADVRTSINTARGRNTSISVLVPARNEEDNIGACLDSLSRQSYPQELYEVIVIDDHSTDGTAALVKGLEIQGRFSLSCLDLAAADAGGEAIKAHKKFAIETGVRAAKGDLIVTTDADCIFHPDWLKTIAAFYEEKAAKFIAAPVKIGDPGRGAGPSLLSVFQTLDFITLQGITGAAVDKNFHSMCNGANLAYEKKAFYEVGGFKGIDTIPSGDDMLLMHKIYQQYPGEVFFLKSGSAIVTTRPETSWTNFVNQRIRWASKADRYDDKRIFRVLLLVYILNLLFVGMLVAGCWDSRWFGMLLAGLAAKTIIEFPFVLSVAAFFGQRRLLVWFPLLQPLHIVYTIVIGWLGQFGTYRWKERKISK